MYSTASGAILLLALALWSPVARADEPPSTGPAALEPKHELIPDIPVDPVKLAHPDVDYTTVRYEPAGFPLIGGDSDVGFQFGVVGTLSRFADGVKPYKWNMDLVLSASVKSGPRGAEIAQESFSWNDDIPELWNGKLRLNPQASYQRTINRGYFGLGNASSSVLPRNYVGPAGRYFEWEYPVARATIPARLTLSGPWSVIAALEYRFINPSAYADSKLARDNEARNTDGTPILRGLRPLSLPEGVVGAIYDSRDSEIFTRSGAFNQVAVSAVQAFPANAGVEYGEAQFQFSAFRSLGPLVLAGRLVADFEFGHVPFYDLIEAGPLGQTEAIGGSAAIRGVPVGRYSGEIKIFGNAELRAMLWHFSVLKQKFTVGGDLLFDTGRTWVDYSFNSPLDGTGLGLKYGAGGGLYLLWGQAAMFRLEAAYSPSATEANPHFPVGVYVEDGTMF